MAQPYVGEIRMFGGNFAPVGWLFCDGSLLQISDNEVLYYLIGTNYGGDGQTTFALPDLRGRIPIHMGTNAFGTWNIAQSGGTEIETLTVNQMPAHAHSLQAAPSLASRRNPRNSVLATTKDPLYSPPAPVVAMANPTLLPAGANMPHPNLQPYLCVNFIISLYGLYPSQT